MKFVIVLAVILQGILASPSIKDTCDNPLVELKGLKFSNGDKINKDTVMTVSINTKKQLASDASATVDLSIGKRAFFNVYIPIPSFMIGAAASRAKLPAGVEFVKGSTFKVDCRAAKRFMPVCPPPPGETDVPYDFNFMLSKLENNPNLHPAFKTLLKWFSKGDYKFSGSAKLNLNGEKLACFEAKVSIKL